MPIPREQFNEGLDDTSYRVIEFLKAHSKEAFEVSEVAEAVFGSASAAKQSPELLAKSKRMEFYLADLVQKGQVERKDIGGKSYYAFHQG